MDKKPIVTQLTLSKDYKFMYENFVISTQREMYLLLQNHGGQIDALKFDFIIYKYGYPNDEGLGVHPMSKFGLGFYGLFRVDNSEWIDKLEERRPKTTWDLFADYQHYIVTFKDVTIDIVSKGFKEVTLTADEVIELTKKEINNLIAE
jgi:hypothetical protein